MKCMLIEEVVNAVNGSLKNYFDLKIKINGVSTDTRNDLKNRLFIPLKGENFDGHNFIESAFENGAVCCISEREIKTDKPVIIVKNTGEALKELARYYLGQFDIPVIAITGSVGKTTTKDMIASVLSEKFKTVKTEGNLNNEIGLPLTVFNVDETTECVVLEMGMSNKNEIHNLSKIAVPDVCIITNIGVSHIETLGSQENILSAKCEIFDFMKDNGLAILNGDDSLLSKVGKNLNKGQVAYFGIENKDCTYSASNIAHNGLSGTSFTVTRDAEFFDLYVPTTGLHMVQNALCAVAVAFKLNLDKDQISKGISNFKPSKMRMDIVKTEKFTIINGVYNASPDSMKATIDVLSTLANSVCILGDMLNLGELSNDLHFKIGEYAKNKNINKIICVGSKAKYIYDGAKGHSFIKYFETQEKMFDELQNILSENDTILVKASRGMEFEKTISYLSSMNDLHTTSD